VSSSDATDRRRADVEAALDAGAVALVVVAICAAADRWLLMTALVPAVMGARLALWRHLVGPTGLGRELALCGLCVAVGAFNDWNTVVGHGVYAYDVPLRSGATGALPVWMLLFWGQILRLVASLAAWPRLGPVGPPVGRFGLPRRRVDRPLARLVVIGVLVVSTRQAVFAWYGDPLLSWLPFAGASVLWWLLLGVDRHDATLAGLALTVGVGVEAALITVGGLHRYELPLVGGVPLWIVLWWPLGVLVWKDLGGRARTGLERSGKNAPGPRILPA